MQSSRATRRGSTTSTSMSCRARSTRTSSPASNDSTRRSARSAATCATATSPGLKWGRIYFADDVRMKIDRREFLGGSSALLVAGALASVPRGLRAALPKPELLGSYWTFAGGALPHSDKEFATFDFRERAEALSTAGFTGMGLWHADLAKSLEKYTLKEMRSIFRDNGLKNVELEFLTDWFLDGEKKQASDKRKRLLLGAAETFEARHVKVGDFDNSKVEMPKLIDAWAALCKDGADHGTRILFELMPFSMRTSLKDTLAMLDGA